MPTRKPREPKKLEERKPKQLSLGFESLSAEERVKHKLFAASRWAQANYKMTPAKIKTYCIPTIPKLKLLAEHLRSIANQHWMLKNNEVAFNEIGEFKRELSEYEGEISSGIRSLDTVTKSLLELLYNSTGEPTLFNKLLTRELGLRSENDFTPEEAFLNATYLFDIALLNPETKTKIPPGEKQALTNFLLAFLKLE